MTRVSAGANDWASASPGHQQSPCHSDHDIAVDALARVQPPLTAAGIARFAGVLAAAEVTVTGSLPSGDTTKAVTHFIVDTAKNSIVGQVIVPNATRQNTSVSVIVKVPASGGSYAIGTFDDAGKFQPTSFLKVNSAAAPSGAMGR